MNKVRPLSVQEIVSAVRKRPVPTRRGMFVSELYYITESECRALLLAWQRKNAIGGGVKP